MISTNIDLVKIVGGGYKSFWKSKTFFRILKGGRASKKSKTMALWSIYNVMKYPSANMVVIRNVYGTLEDSAYAELQWATEQLGVAHLWRFKKDPLKAVYNPTGQVILFRGFDDVAKLTSITVKKGELCWAWLNNSGHEKNFPNSVDTLKGQYRARLLN